MSDAKRRAIAAAMAAGQRDGASEATGGGIEEERPRGALGRR
jgi:hypothetical protein